MKIRYVVTRGDLLFATLRSILRNRFLSVLWSALIVWACYDQVHSAKVVDHSTGYKVFLCVFLAATYLVMLFGATFVLTSAMVLLRKNTGLLGEHELSISDEGIVESTAHNHSTYRWSCYHRTVSTRNYLMLYVTEGQFHIISKRRRLLGGDLAAFEALLREKTKRAQQAARANARVRHTSC